MPLLRPTSEEEVANLALDRCKEDEIATFDDDLHRARVARRHFGLVRDALLAELDWNWASSWQVHPAPDVTDSPGPLKKRFILLTDTIVVRQVFSGSDASIELGDSKWKLETGRVTIVSAEVEAKVLVCNEPAVAVRYTRRVEAVAIWEPLFIDVFVCKLAAAMAPALGRSRGEAASLLAEAEEILGPKAKRIDSREASPEKVGGRRATSWLAARSGFRTALMLTALATPLPSDELAFPNETNTGPAAGTFFTAQSGVLTSSAPGQVFQNLDLTGQINIDHNFVTIRDCIIRINGFFGTTSNNTMAKTGIVIERCRFLFAGGAAAAAIAVDNAVGCEIRFNDISGSEDGIKITGDAQNIHDNYIHDLVGQGGDPHVDGIQGTGGFTSLTIRHNTVKAFDTSCIILQNETGSFSGVVIDNNLLMGVPTVAHLILCQAKDEFPANTCSNITITNNHYVVDTATFKCFLHNVTGLVYANNVNHVTGAQVPFENGGGVS